MIMRGVPASHHQPQCLLPRLLLKKELLELAGPINITMPSTKEASSQRSANQACFFVF